MTEHGEGTVRILQVFSDGMGRAGAETWMMHVLRHTDRNRFRMDFLVETTKPQAYDDEIRDLGSRVISCSDHRRPLTYARNFKEILRDKGPYDIVHSHLHHYSGYVLRLARQAGVPVRIAHSHNDFTPDDRKRGVPWGAYTRLMNRWITRYATAGLAASHEAARALFGAAWEADPRWRLLYYGINPKPFRASVDPVAVRAELGIPADAFVMGHVGRFLEQKNHEFLVDIASEVAKREPKARLLMVGAGSLRSSIERRVAQVGIKDRAIFAGVRPDVPRLMLGAMDVFVLPSFFEGLPVVGIEAQTAGLPFVLSDVISKEMDVVHPLINRLSLSQPAHVWAETILAARNARPLVDQRDALHLMEDSYFNINSSVRELERVYAG